MSKVSSVWKVYIFEAKYKHVDFTYCYTLKIRDKNMKYDDVKKKVRKDFKKDLKNKNTFFNLERVR